MMETHERIERLSRQLDGMPNDCIREELIGLYGDAKHEFDDYQSLQAKIEVYEEALKFYADKSNYRKREKVLYVDPARVIEDEGAIAKAALGGGN